MDNLELLVMIVFAAFCLVLLGMVIASVAGKVSQFRDELRMINMEISRTTGAERKRWKARKKRIWKRMLPFGRNN